MYSFDAMLTHPLPGETPVETAQRVLQLQLQPLIYNLDTRVHTLNKVMGTFGVKNTLFPSFSKFQTLNFGSPLTTTPVLTALPSTKFHSHPQPTITPVHKNKPTKPPIPALKGKRAWTMKFDQTVDLTGEDQAQPLVTGILIQEEP